MTTDEKSSALAIGPRTGAVNPSLRTDDLVAALAALSERVAAVDDETVAAGADRIVPVELPTAAGPMTMAVKCFARQSAMKDRSDRHRGSRARRSWEAAAALAAAGVGTPQPVAYLDEWRDGRLLESLYISRFEADAVTLHDELRRLYRERCSVATLMTLLERVAVAIRRMHDVGVVHRDLGNQNILLHRRGDDDWDEASFVDLNRARIRPALPLEERAADLARLELPSDFMRILVDMYFAPEVVPEAFREHARRARRRFVRHTNSRRFRHPLRALRPGYGGRSGSGYPHPKDLWIWDERSAQAIGTLVSADRRRLYPTSNLVGMATATARAAWPVRKRFKALMASAYGQPVAMADCVGVALEPRPETIEREIAALKDLGVGPVLLRFYHHETREEWEFTATVARRLHGDGHRVMAAVVQDRRAVLEPADWAAFAAWALERVGDIVDCVEIGHAINRVKWGIWSLDEYKRMMAALEPVLREHSNVRITGPAAIDFEYPFLLGALSRLPADIRLHALSHHLYVDRRGAPENRQGGMSTVEKCALARAIAQQSTACDDRLIVSEVNWPLAGTGVYSPVGSPYEAAGPRSNDPSVGEDDYADYMVRYILLAVCSGMVERVYWWRLVARGFGLIDDTNADDWRRRPAYDRLRALVQFLDGCTFVERSAGPEGVYILRFSHGDGSSRAIAWAHPGERRVDLPFALADGSSSVALSGRPELFLELG